MKRFLIAMTALLTITLSASAMSYEQARQQALFLTDKMAYELNLTEEQYEAAYEVNLDYLMSVNNQADLYGAYWTQRNLDLSYILLDWQYNAYLAASYFYRPLYWEAGYWHFGIYARYPYRDYFYFGRPHFWYVYRGGHSWRMNGGRSWYHGRTFAHRGHGGQSAHRGMRDGFQRGDYGRGHGGPGNRGGMDRGGARGRMDRGGARGGMDRGNGVNRGGMDRGSARGGMDRGNMNRGGMERGNMNRGGMERGSSVNRGMGSTQQRMNSDRGTNRPSIGSGSVHQGSTFSPGVSRRPAGGSGNSMGSSSRRSIGSSIGSSSHSSPSRSFSSGSAPSRSIGSSSRGSSFGGSRGGGFSGGSRGGSFGSGSRGGSFGGGSRGGGFSGGHGGGHGGHGGGRR